MMKSVIKNMAVMVISGGLSCSMALAANTTAQSASAFDWSNSFSHPYFFLEAGSAFPMSAENSAVGTIRQDPDYSDPYFTEIYKNDVKNTIVSYGIGAGIMLPKPFAVNWLANSDVELLFSYIPAEIHGTHTEDFTSTSTPSLNSTFSRDYNYKVDNYLFLINYIMNFNLATQGWAKKIQPFAEVGAGFDYYSVNDFDEAAAPADQFPEIDTTTLGQSKINPAYDLGMGVNWLFASHFTGTLGYRYIDGGNASTGDVVGTDDGVGNYNFGSTTTNNKFSQVYLRLSYRI